jgi:hypothetical protein
MIEIYAGPTARRQIDQHGFSADLFSSFLGASGGPKWFVLYGLDRYLFGEFFKDRSRPLHLFGSSAGAFRAACIAQAQPLTALQTLATTYTDTTYSKFASPAEVSSKVRLMLHAMFPDDAVEQVLTNPIFKLHVSVARCHGMAASQVRLMQLAGMLSAKRRNRRDRSGLAMQFERYVFQSVDSGFAFNDPWQLPTRRVDLNRDNLIDAVLASGSLPVIMQGVSDIAGCDGGIYRDGGIVDYQFDLDIAGSDLVLYPHYSTSLKPGWFDKKLNRLARTANHDRTVMICPSPEFVQSLPYQKIPDRDDFSKMDDAQRIDYWRRVVDQTQMMADAFAQWVERPTIEHIRDIEQLTAA